MRTATRARLPIPLKAAWWPRWAILSACCKEAYAEALADAAGSYKASDGNKKTTREGGVKYSLPDMSSVMQTDEEVENNIRYVARMDSVYHVSADKLEFGDRRVQDIYKHYFDLWGNNIHSDIFGDIAAVNSSVRSEKRHGTTLPKIASIEAISAVIQNGKIIGYINKYNGKLLRIVVAAPIDIGNTQYYMGVMLQRDIQNQRLYIHDVVINKEASELSQEHLDSTGPYEENEDLFLTSIIKKVLAVKGESTEKLSDRDPTAAATAQALEVQKRALEADVEDLAEMLRLQGDVTRKNSSSLSAARYLSTYHDVIGSKQDPALNRELAGLLKDFYTYLDENKDLSWEQIAEKAKPVTEWIFKHTEAGRQRSEYARNVLAEIRNKPIRLTEAERAQAAEGYDSYGAFRKSAMGSLTLANQGTSLEDALQEWSWNSGKRTAIRPAAYDARQALYVIWRNSF